MRYIKIFLYLLAALMVGVFAVNNKQLVEISLFPFPVNFSIAAFLLFFAAFALGVLVGGGLQTFRVIYWKRVANSAKKRAENLESESRETNTNKKLSIWQSK